MRLFFIRRNFWCVCNGWRADGIGGALVIVRALLCDFLNKVGFV